MIQSFSGAISSTVAFLRTVTPLMTESDLNTFKEVCDHLLEGTTTVDDIRKLNEIEGKFLGGE